jgi:hypothetical protein
MRCRDTCPLTGLRIKDRDTERGLVKAGRSLAHILSEYETHFLCQTPFTGSARHTMCTPLYGCPQPPLQHYSILLQRTVLVVAWCVAAIGLWMAAWQECESQQLLQTPHAHYLQPLHTNTFAQPA